MRNMICLVLATVLFGQSVLEARVSASAAARAGQAQSQSKPTVKERILEVPPGTMIEVRLLDKTKIKGRLGEITDQNFTLQTAQGNKIATQQIAFADLKSFKQVGGKGGHGWYILAGVGITVTVIVIAAIVVAASSD